MKTVLIIEAQREGYSIHQCPRTMTVGELTQLLSDYSDDTPIYFSHDNGYTYGSLKEDNIDERYDDEQND